MSSKVCIFLTIAVAAGFFLGWLVRGSGVAADVAVPSNSSDRPSPHPGGAGDDRLSGRVDIARRDAADPGASEADASVLIDSERLLALLDAKVPRLEERDLLVQPDGELEQLIGMTDRETRSMNEMWERVKPELDSLQTANVAHQRLDDGGVWLGVGPFPEGEVLRQEFLLTTHRVLGEARSRVFLGAVGAHAAFGSWGKTVGSGFTIHLFAQEDDSLLYEIIEQAAGDGSRGRKWNTSKVPPHLSELATAAGIALTP